MVEQRHTQILNQVDQKFQSLRNTVNSTEDLPNFFSQIHNEEYNSLTPEQARQLHNQDAEHPKLQQPQEQNAMVNFQSERVEFNETIELINQIRNKYNEQYGNINCYLKEVQRQMQDFEIRMNQTQGQILNDPTRQLSQVQIDEVQQFNQNMLQTNGDNMNNLIKKYENQYLENTMKSIQIQLQRAFNIGFDKNQKTFKITGNVYFGPEGTIFYKDQSKVVIARLNRQFLNFKELEETTHERIQCLTYDQQYICLCFESKIWILKYMNMSNVMCHFNITKVKEIPTEYRPNTAVCLQQAFIISGPESNNCKNEKIISIENNFEVNDSFSGISSVHQLTLRKNKDSIFCYRFYQKSDNHCIVNMKLAENRQNLNSKSSISSTYLYGTPLILGEVDEDQMLYYDFAASTLKLWNISQDNSVKLVKIQGLEEDYESIVYMALHPNFMKQNCKWMITLDDKSQLRVRKVSLIQDQNMALDSLKRPDVGQADVTTIKVELKSELRNCIDIHVVTYDAVQENATVQTTHFSNEQLQQLQ